MIAQLNKSYIHKRPWKVFPRFVSYFLYEGRPLTTKGQWINPFVLGHLRVQKHLPYQKKVEKPIFITGIGRSGSTLLGVLLSLHPKVGFLNEPKALWHSVVPDEDVIGTYSDTAARFRLTRTDATPQARKWARRLYASYLSMSSSARVVDKYPELIYRVPFLLSLFPDARIIFLIRNGEHVCGSVDSWSDRKEDIVGAEIHDWWGRDKRKWHILFNELVAPNPIFSSCTDKIKFYENHADMATVEWIVAMQEGLSMAQKYSNSVYAIRYEDILNTPVKALSALLDFCELPKDEKMLSYAASILHSPTAYRELKVVPELESLFRSTMQQLGYADD